MSDEVDVEKVSNCAQVSGKTGRMDALKRVFVSFLIGWAVFGKAIDPCALPAYRLFEMGLENLVQSANSFSGILQRLSYFGAERTYLISAGGVILLLWMPHQKKHQIPGKTVLSFLLACSCAYGRVISDGAEPLGTKLQILFLAVEIYGLTLFYMGIADLLYSLLGTCRCTLSPTGNRIKEAGKSSYFIHVFCVLMICWTPHVLIKYPAGLCYDPADQINMGLGISPLTGGHPIFHTMLLTWTIRLGMTLGSPNLAMMVLMILQMVLFGLIVAHMAQQLREMGAAEGFTQGLVLFFCLNPYVIGYIGCAVKDALYAAGFSSFLFGLAMYAMFPERFWKKKNLAWFVAAGWIVCLVRHNGMLIALAVVVAILASEAKRRRLSAGRAVALLLVAAVPLGVNALLNGLYHPAPGKITELLTVPFQQTARTAQVYDDATEDERKAIDRVLKYDEMASAYRVYISDPVKALYQEGSSREDLLGYFGAWFEQGKRHPLCYLQAFLRQNAQVLNPEFINSEYYVSANPEKLPWKETAYCLSPDWLIPIQTCYEKMLLAVHRIPGISVFCTSANFWIMAALLYLFMKKDNVDKAWIVMIPYLITFVLWILGPVTAAQPRYELPVIYSVPMLLGVYNARRMGGNGATQMDC